MIHKRLLLLVAFVVSVFGGRSFSQDVDTLAHEVKQIVDRAELGRFWGAVVVRVGDRTILAKGYGFEDDQLAPISAKRSLFDVGSVSKSITAATVLALVDAGKIQLNTTLGDVWGAQAGNCTEVTIEELIRHRSGIGQGRGVFQTQILSSEDLIEAVGQLSLPGKTFEYSNVGYFVLAATIEKVSEMSFEDAVRKYVLDPLGMNGVGFVGDGDVEGMSPTARIQRDPYSGEKRGSLFHYPWNWGQRGATGVVMSADAAAQWFETIGDGHWDTQDPQHAMTTPGDSGYGLGVYVEVNGEHEPVMIWHGGSTGGYRSHVAHYPQAFGQQGATVAILAGESSNVDSIAKSIRRIIAPPQAKPNVLGVYLQQYRELETEGQFHIEGDLRWKGMSQYRGRAEGKNFVDDRPTLVLEDSSRGGWALILRLEHNDAEQLSDDLESVLQQIANDPEGGKSSWSKGITLHVDIHGLSLNEYDAIVSENYEIVVRATDDHHEELVVILAETKHEVVRVRMGGAESRALRDQIRSATR